MAYPGVALLAMVGIGIGFALWYFLAEDPVHAQGGHQNFGGPPPPRSPSPSNNSWNEPRNPRRRRRKSNAKATYDCIICTEPMNGVYTETNCGHMFHQKCIEKWQAVQDGPTVRCPLCRQPI